MKEFLITLKQTEKVTRFGLFYCLGVCILGAVFGLFMSLSMMFAWKTRNNFGNIDDGYGNGNSSGRLRTGVISGLFPACTGIGKGQKASDSR